jgi:hypothetical protein
MSATNNLSEIVAKVDDEIENATSAKNVTQELLLVSSPLNHCEDMLLPAPMAITLTSKLILISNKNDFTLRQKQGGYRYLHWTSFRAAFAEIAHGLQTAFRLANKNMQEICMRSSDIPKEFNRAVVIIKKAPIDEVGEVLKIPLDQIKSTTDACLKLAEDVEANFILVTNMTEELFEATVDKEKATDEELKEIEKRRIGIIQAEKLAEERKTDNAIRLKELEKKVGEADDLFKTSFKESDQMVIMAALTENIAQVLKTGMTTFAPLLAKDNVKTAVAALPQLLQAVEIGKNALAGQSSENGDFVEFEPDEMKSANKQDAKTIAYSKATCMLNLAENLFGFISSDDTIGDDAVNEQEYVSYKQSYVELKRSLVDPAKISKNAKNALDLCCKGWTVCNEMEKLLHNPEKVNKKDLVKDIKSLFQNCKEFTGKAQMFLGGGVSLNKIGKKKSNAKSNDGLVNAAVNHAHYKLELSLEYLKTNQENFDKAQDERNQLMNEMAERAKQIQEMNIDEVDYKNVRECLIKGLQVLGDLRKQWEYLVQYFQKMSTLIQMASNTSGKFRALAEQQIKSKFLREFVYEEAFEAVKLAVIVRQLSKTYSEISQRFLMPQVGALDLFFNARDQSDQITANQQIAQNQTDAQNGIRLIIENGRTELLQVMNNRRSQLQAIIDTLEPLMSIEEKESNKSCAERVAAISPVDDNKRDVDADIERDIKLNQM